MLILLFPWPNKFFSFIYFNKNFFHHIFPFSVIKLSVPKQNIHFSKTKQSFKAQTGNPFLKNIFNSLTKITSVYCGILTDKGERKRRALTNAKDSSWIVSPTQHLWHLVVWVTLGRITLYHKSLHKVDIIVANLPMLRTDKMQFNSASVSWVPIIC